MMMMVVVVMTNRPDYIFKFLLVVEVNLVAIFWSHQHCSKAKR